MDEHAYREEEIALRHREVGAQEHIVARGKWANPLVLGLLTFAVALYGNYLIDKHNREARELAVSEFCYRVLSDLLQQDSGKREASAKALNQLLAAQAVNDCRGDLREAADLYSSSNSFKTIVDPDPLQRCESVKPLVELGWRSGHKTRFCQALGYDGVHNPFGDYSAGGFCFSGDSSACIAKITSGG